MSCYYLKHCISPKEKKNIGVMFQIADPWA